MAALGGKDANAGLFRSALDFVLRSNTRNKVLTRLGGAAQTKTHDIELPKGYPASHVSVTLSLSSVKALANLEFCEHVTDAQGRATDIVLASTFNGFAISRDLGESWKAVKIRGYESFRVLHAKWLGESEVLVQAVSSREEAARDKTVTLLVVNEDGDVMAAHEMEGSPWHGCRSVDMAGGVLMYAEYPYEDEDALPDERLKSRVFRSRDRGRSWDIANKSRQVRHFHFLQARPGHPGEWWLTSGDEPEESNIWVTTDDGDDWRNITRRFDETIEIGGVSYPRSLFRLTDLAWIGDEVIWGTDDDLRSTRGAEPGARIFRSPCIFPPVPSVVGRISWPVRSMVDVGDFYVFITQSGGGKRRVADEKKPGVFLMPKKPVAGAPGLVHLFDVDTRPTGRTGFTYSRASRAAKDGTFFTFRASTDAFSFGHKVLRWDMRFS
jgi:hypothetical protein